jgi:adenylosuccinate synthase
MKNYRCLVVVGAQWGDEGKGKIVDVLAAEVASSRATRAAPTRGTPSTSKAMSSSFTRSRRASCTPSTRCLLGNGVVVDLEQFFEEIDALHDRGIEAEPRIGISGRAHLLLEYHKRSIRRARRPAAAPGSARRAAASGRPTRTRSRGQASAWPTCRTRPGRGR